MSYAFGRGQIFAFEASYDYGVHSPSKVFELPLMLVGVFAAPTRYSEWVIYLLGCLLQCKYGTHYQIFSNSIEELRSAWNSRSGVAVLLRTDWPNSEMSRFLIDAGVPLVVVADDPLLTVLARSPYVGISEAIRTTSGHLATLSPAFEQDRSIKVDTWFLREPLETLLSVLSSRLFGEVDREIIDAVKAKMAPDEPDIFVQDLVDRFQGGGPDLDALLRDLTPDQIRVARSIAGSYGKLLTDGGMDEAEWPLELFSFDTPGHNLVGGSRRIILGPFLHLPVGRWRATIQCETAENLSGNDLGAEIWTPRGHKVVQGTVSLPIQGVFEFSLYFDVADPTDFIELVIYLLKGAIEGKFKMRSVSVRRAERRGETNLLEG